jgi:hypothetical protein
VCTTLSALVSVLFTAVFNSITSKSVVATTRKPPFAAEKGIVVLPSETLPLDAHIGMGPACETPSLGADIGKGLINRVPRLSANMGLSPIRQTPDMSDSDSDSETLAVLVQKWKTEEFTEKGSGTAL